MPTPPDTSHALAPTTPVSPAKPGAAVTTIAVQELDCAAEEQVLRKAVGGMPGVAAVECNVVTRAMTVTHDAAATTPGQLAAKVRAVGMTPTVLTLAGAANGSATGGGADAGSDCGGAACATGDDHAATRDDARPWWRKYGLFILAGVLAAGAEAMYFAGVKETSWPVIAASVLSILLGGLPTLKKGWIALRTFTLNINFLMTVAIVGGAFIGAWPEIALVTFLFTLAELIEKKALDRARNAVKGLMAMAPDEASVQQPDGSWALTSAGAVAVGSVVRVKPGERLALDGVVVAGESSVNQAPVTGESVPVDKKVGEKVFAGTINESGVLEFRTTGGKDQTTLAKIIRTVQEAQGSRAPTQRFVDNFAKVYTPIVCIVAVLIAVVPWLAFNQPFYPWLYKALVLLVIACPCALVISTPVTVVSGLTAAARRGILIKGGVHLENGRRLNVIALDKTGTITEGKPRVTDVQPRLWRGHHLAIRSEIDHVDEHLVRQGEVIERARHMRVVVRIKNRSDGRLDELVEDPRVILGSGRLLRVPDLRETESERSAQATEEEPNLQASRERRCRDVDIRVERLDGHVRVCADLAQSLCRRIDVLAALEECVIDAAVLVAGWTGETQHVEAIAESAEAQVAELLEVELFLGHGVLRNPEMRRVELVEELVGDPAPTARRRELEQTVLVAEVVDAHRVDDDVLP